MRWIDTIEKYVPWNEQEKKDKEVILQCISTFNDILTRENQIAHMTSSAFIINKHKDKVLMVYHNIYQSWSWVGGHADGEEDLLYVAMKEAKEETGVKNISILEENILSLDVLPVEGHIKKGKYVAPHLHLSVTYLMEADEEEKLIIKPDENSDVQWIPLEEVGVYSTEPYMIKIYNKIRLKLKKFDE
ncbi:NUDIX hydrolase [Irregularibacter muris]|uniref:NUDIX hydrolase n=1 Tax=Irregularibacter muris TaxID=1796619 RepID=A0AAE3HEF0_9FIRM|nr:NUDIX hydrolase [Irregularibacter muris]MCR1898601.1 NUDIX hydrolase [Irregularibacter muris]